MDQLRADRNRQSLVGVRWWSADQSMHDFINPKPLHIYKKVLLTTTTGAVGFDDTINWIPKYTMDELINLINQSIKTLKRENTVNKSTKKQHCWYCSFTREISIRYQRSFYKFHKVTTRIIEIIFIGTSNWRKLCPEKIKAIIVLWNQILKSHWILRIEDSYLVQHKNLHRYMAWTNPNKATNL